MRILLELATEVKRPQPQAVQHLPSRNEYTVICALRNLEKCETMSDELGNADLRPHYLTIPRPRFYSIGVEVLTSLLPSLTPFASAKRSQIRWKIAWIPPKELSPPPRDHRPGHGFHLIKCILSLFQDNLPQ
ncbi:hypothetical protein AUP68_13248 [Ilyonectria robusta]